MNPSGQQIKSKQCPLLLWLHDWNAPVVSPSLVRSERLVGHVDAEFRRRDEVLPRTLRDHHARLLVEHGGDLRRRLGDGQVIDRLGVLAALEVVGHVAVFPQEGEELQQEVAEVLADAEPPCGKIRGGSDLYSPTTRQKNNLFNQC